MLKFQFELILQRKCFKNSKKKKPKTKPKIPKETVDAHREEKKKGVEKCGHCSLGLILKVIQL